MVIKNNDVNLKYFGSWGSFVKENEEIKYSASKGDYVELTFNGTSIEFYTHTNAWRGMADVYIDGIKVATIDTYSKEEVFNALIFKKTGLKEGEHTLKIEINGSKNLLAIEGKVAIYRFVASSELIEEPTELEELKKENERLKAENLILQEQANVNLNELKNIIEDLKGMINNA